MIQARRLKPGACAFMAGLLVASLAPLSISPAWALNVVPKPQDGTTQDQPFARGTGQSGNFRIPAMVALNNGTLVAATDARWNVTGDGGGLDTIVSRSVDGGKNWSYTYANHLGDNGNEWNRLSSCFIDPALATDGNIVHMVVDLFPAGIALNSARWSPVVGSEFDDQGHLKLRAADTAPFISSNNNYNRQAANAPYDYYLDEEAGVVRRAGSGDVVEGYSVDDHFNITRPDGTKTNLFFEDSPYMPFPTSYLYMTSSNDGGKTWGAPKLIRAKRPNEQTLLIGPGTGSVLADGTLVFSVYEHTHGKEAASLITSTDGGKTWKRSANATSHPHWSSEAVAVPLRDDVLRQFYRDGHSSLFYTDFTRQADGSWVPGKPVDTGQLKTVGNQLSAYRSAQLYDGKPCIVVSTAASGSRSRINGRIYMGVVESDGSMTWRHMYRVVEEGRPYSYSTIAELPDGSCALLYEDSNGTERFVTIPRDQLVNPDTDLSLDVKHVSLSMGGSETFIQPGDVTGADTSEFDTKVADLNLKVVAGEGAGNTEVTIVAKRPGKAKVTLGATRYVVSVGGEEQTLPERPEIGKTMTFEVAGKMDESALKNVDPLVARVEVEPIVGVSAGRAAKLMKDACYSLTKTDDGLFVLSNKANKDKVFLSATGQAHAPGYPFAFDETKIRIMPTDTPGIFNVCDRPDMPMSRALVWWKGKFDRVTVPVASRFAAAAKMEFFRMDVQPVSEGADKPRRSRRSAAEVPGFTRVETVEDLVPGEYMVGHHDESGNLHLISPSIDTADPNAHVGALDPEGASRVSVTPVGPGSTSFYIGNRFFSIEVPKPVSKTALAEALGAAEELRKDVRFVRATPELREAYEAALAAGELVSRDADATQEAVDDAVDAINKAKDALDGKDPANKEFLNKALSQADDIRKDVRYIKASEDKRAAYEEVLKQGAKLAADEAASQEDVDAVYKAIQDAQLALDGRESPAKRVDDAMKPKAYGGMPATGDVTVPFAVASMIVGLVAVFTAYLRSRKA